MWMKNSYFVIALLFVMFFIKSGNAQNGLSSPYSGFGFGKVNNNVSMTSHSMGGLSYALQNPYYINFKNPASYIAFDSLSFIADAAFSMISTTLKTNEKTQKYMMARPNYLAIGLPLTKHWRTSAGILPYSDMGYTILNNTTDLNGNKSYTYEGDGGLMQLFWGNAFKLYRGLSIGVNASYMFGRMTSLRTVEIEGSNFFNTSVNNSTNVDGIYLSGGIQYFFDIKEKHRFGLGAVYENTAYLWARQNELITIFQGTYDNMTGLDTISNIVGAKGNMIVPQSIGGGFSYSYNNQLLFGADVTWQNWEKYRLMGKSDSLKNAWTINVGAQYTPNPLSSKYMSRINIRAGVKYSTGYFAVQGKPVDELGVAFGLGFPLKGTNSNSSLNILIEYGQWGTLKKNVISENYIKLSFNFILQEKWYQRVKLE